MPKKKSMLQRLKAIKSEVGKDEKAIDKHKLKINQADEAVAAMFESDELLLMLQKLEWRLRKAFDKPAHGANTLELVVEVDDNRVARTVWNVLSIVKDLGCSRIVNYTAKLSGVRLVVPARNETEPSYLRTYVYARGLPSGRKEILLRGYYYGFSDVEMILDIASRLGFSVALSHSSRKLVQDIASEYEEQLEEAKRRRARAMTLLEGLDTEKRGKKK